MSRIVKNQVFKVLNICYVFSRNPGYWPSVLVQSEHMSFVPLGRVLGAVKLNISLLELAYVANVLGVILVED